MAENQIQLTLTPIQQSQYFAHLFVYLFGQASDPTRSRHKATGELVQEVAYRLFYECRQECRERTFTVSVEEAQAVKDAFAHLSHAYAQPPAVKAGAVAQRTRTHRGKRHQASVQRDLAACLRVLEQAEQHTATQTACRADDER